MYVDIKTYLLSICYSSTLMFNLLICKCNVFRHKVRVITIIILTLPHSGTRLGTRASNEGLRRFYFHREGPLYDLLLVEIA